MRQHIIRALVVLLVAGVLAAGWYGVAQTAGAQAPVPARETNQVTTDAPLDDLATDREWERGDRDDAERSRQPSLDRQRDHDERRAGEAGSSLLGAVPGMAVNLGIIAVVIVVVLALQKGLSTRTPGSQSGEPAGNSSD